jgi:hypothetical protein
MINATALKPSQCRTHSSQLSFRSPHQRIRQTSALAEREKQKMQLTHSLAEPRPPGIALRRRSKTASGPRSFAIRWLSLKVASAPKTKMNQLTFLTRSLSAIRQARCDARNFHRKRNPAPFPASLAFQFGFALPHRLNFARNPKNGRKQSPTSVSRSISSQSPH